MKPTLFFPLLDNQTSSEMAAQVKEITLIPRDKFKAGSFNW